MLQNIGPRANICFILQIVYYALSVSNFDLTVIMRLCKSLREYTYFRIDGCFPAICARPYSMLEYFTHLPPNPAPLYVIGKGDKASQYICYIRTYHNYRERVSIYAKQARQKMAYYMDPMLSFSLLEEILLKIFLKQIW